MRKRSKYRQKHPPGHFVLPLNIRYGQREETNLQLVPHSELQKLRDGDADEYTWNTVCFRLNWGYVMAGEHYPDAIDTMLKALEAIKSVKQRHDAAGRWGASGEEFFALGDGLNMTDEMQKATTRAQQLAAARVTMAVSEYKKEFGEV